MPVPNLSDLMTETFTVPLTADRSITCTIRAAPSPEWLAACEASRTDDGTIDYDRNLDRFLHACLVAMGSDEADPIDLDADDIQEIADTFPTFVVAQILARIVRLNVIGFRRPKD